VCYLINNKLDKACGVRHAACGMRWAACGGRSEVCFRVLGAFAWGGRMLLKVMMLSNIIINQVITKVMVFSGSPYLLCNPVAKFFPNHRVTLNLNTEGHNFENTPCNSVVKSFFLTL